MAMIVSRNATKDFTPNPLASPAYMDGKDWNWNRQFGRFGLAGMMGLGETDLQLASRLMQEALRTGRVATMARDEAIAQIAAGAGPGSAAYESYYGAGGMYEQAASVKAAAAEPDYYDAGPSGPPAPMLYAAKVCGAAEMGTTDCVAFNAAVQRANMAIQENARRAWNLQVCKQNAAINPGTNDVPCTQFEARLPEPVVPGGIKQQAVCSGGECYTPFVGGTSTDVPIGPFKDVVPPTPQQQASYIANKANQTVPPKPQPGEVPKDGGGGTGDGDGEGDGKGDGKIFGMDPIMLAVIAGVGLLLVVRK